VNLMIQQYGHTTGFLWGCVIEMTTRNIKEKVVRLNGGWMGYRQDSKAKAIPVTGCEGPEL
jgi:hypothetical protein